MSDYFLSIFMTNDNFYFDVISLFITTHCNLRIFDILYHHGQVYWWRKPEYPEKTTDLPFVTDNFIA